MEVRAIAVADRPWVTRVIADHFASPRIVSRGILHDCQALPGLVVVRDTAPCGVLLYDIRGAECEVIALVSLVRRTGAATALLDAVEDLARSAACRRVWLITTNDNQPAIDFYSGRGWSLRAIHEGAVAEARHLKREIPHFGHNGVPVRDELEFELLLSGSSA